MHVSLLAASLRRFMTLTCRVVCASHRKADRISERRTSIPLRFLSFGAADFLAKDGTTVSGPETCVHAALAFVVACLISALPLEWCPL